MKKLIATLMTTVVGVLFFFCGFTVSAEENKSSKTEEGQFHPYAADEYKSYIKLNLESERVIEDYGRSLSVLMKSFDGEYWEYYVDFGNIRECGDITKFINYICENSDSWDLAFRVTESLHLELYVKLNSEEEQVSAENVAETIKSASDGMEVLNNWNVIQLNNLDMKEYDQIIMAIEEDKSLFNFQISDIKVADDEKRFSICFKPRSYLIKKGDTLSEIAEKKLTTVETLMQYNPQIKNADFIMADSYLRIN